jgi:hypothetical protein
MGKLIIGLFVVCGFWEEGRVKRLWFAPPKLSFGVLN